MATAPTISLTTPLSEVAGVGAQTARALRALGISRVGHLIAHLPARHERLEAEGQVASLEVDQLATARGQITATRIAGRGGKRRLEAVLCDDTGRLDLVWFNGAFLRDRIRPGAQLRVHGKVRRYQSGVQMANPQFHVIEAGEVEPAPEGERLRPVYPASERITSRRIEGLIEKILPRVLEELDDHLGENFRRERELPSLRDAYRMMHMPADEAEIATGRRRLAYDELLMLQLGVFIKRTHLRSTLRAPALRHDAQVDARIRERLPFALTEAQERVVEEIARDLSGETPTNRLVQGDVGSGKTVVALYAMLMAVASGQQAALMAPTEILAEQHFLSISAMLRESKVRVELLTGAVAPAERERILSALAAGRADILIGTHALLTETVRFAGLAVAVIDEQHRFGVHQRAKLRAKTDDDATTPHMIVMTATPIPRTLGLTAFGDLDISTIDALPPGRQPIETRLVAPQERKKVYQWLAGRLEAGEQAYIVAPAIEAQEEGAAAGIVDVRTLARELEAGALAGRRLAVLHGRLKRRTREHAMERFRYGRIDALVATTVIEVGVDVPNASIMIVENAERFGLAQLHQLRGRIGRGERRSVCVLIGEAKTDEAARRLEAIAATTDGFALAEKDLELRGPGEVFGTRQAGLPPLRVADLSRDTALLTMARRDARAWVERSPQLAAPEESLLRRRLAKMHGESLTVADVG